MKISSSLLLFALNSLPFTSQANQTEEEFEYFVEDIAEFVNASSTYVSPTNNDAYFLNGDESAEPLEYGTFDFVIVGAGAAGGVLANRLSENNTFSVLVIEAGKADPPISKVLGLFAYLGSSEYDWGYYTIPQNYSCLGNPHQQCPYMRGKVYGGTSTINGGLYSRGNRINYDSWVELGNEGWSFQECLPYFKKSEKAKFSIDIDKEYHGFNGTQAVSVPEDIPILTKALIEAFVETGKTEGDYNGDNQYSVGRPQFLEDLNVRSETAHSYIHPALHRKNLQLSAESLVTKILISNGIATGVEFWKNGTKYVAHAKKEVILSAGSLNTPQILMLSGIGPKDHLEELGIEVIADLPVGQNMMDHVAFMPFYLRVNHSWFNNTLEENLELWRENHLPLTAGSSVALVSFHNTAGNLALPPDIEFVVFGPPQLSSDLGYGLGFTAAYAEPYKVLNPYTDFALVLVLVQPKSLGQLTLQSASPRDFPLHNPNYYSNPDDVEAVYEGVLAIQKVLDTDAFRRLGAEIVNISLQECEDEFEAYSKDWWICYIQHVSQPAYHASCTTRMGTDPSTSVVSPESLKVHGFENLRIVDAGVQPKIVSGHIIATVVMIAEKIVDAINKEYSVFYS